MPSRGNTLIFRALSVACVSVALGCGARTDTLFDDGSLGGSGAGGQAQGGGHPTAGSNGFAGGGNAGGFGNVGAGGFTVAGNSSIGGVGAGRGGGLGGGFPTAGTGFGGGFPTAGTNSGGFGAIGGAAGAGATGGIVDLCISSAPTACNKCQCQTCGSEINACASDIGCALILLCVQQKQCQGFGCYQNSTCRGVIDQFGGLTGASVAEVFSLVTCSATSSQGCGCN